MSGHVMLPWIGCFARAEWKPLRREIPEAPKIELNNEIAPLAGLFPKKRFFDYVFATLVGIRQSPGYEGGSIEALHWLEVKGMIRAVAARVDHPGPFYHVDFELTDAGREFLKQHEAPESWA